MSEMSYKIDLEIVNTFRNKRKTKVVDNQVNEAISDLVVKVEESLTLKFQQKKCYKRYRTQESREQRDNESHPLLSGCSFTTQSSAQKILRWKLESESINITGICHQKRCKCNGCHK